MIEFIYAIVGIVWLTQYYTSCNDLTAKNVTLGMSASPSGGRDGVSSERTKLRRLPKGTVAVRTPGRMVAEAVGFLPSSATRPQGNLLWRGGQQWRSPQLLTGNPQSCLLCTQAGPWGHGSARGNQVARGWGQGLLSLALGPQKRMMIGRRQGPFLQSR